MTTTDDAELINLRNACQTLGKVVSGFSQTMEAARIELVQGKPESALQWILNATPDVWDGPEELAWNGTETAQEWLDRNEAYYRETEATTGEPS